MWVVSTSKVPLVPLVPLVQSTHVTVAFQLDNRVSHNGKNQKQEKESFERDYETVEEHLNEAEDGSDATAGPSLR